MEKALLPSIGHSTDAKQKDGADDGIVEGKIVAVGGAEGFVDGNNEAEGMGDGADVGSGVGLNVGGDVILVKMLVLHDGSSHN